MTDQQPHTPTTARIKDAYRRSRVWESGNGSDTYEKEFDRWHDAEIAAAEQRGATKALREAAGAIEKNQIMTQVGHLQPCNSCMIIHMDFLDYRADQMEGDDETH